MAKMGQVVLRHSCREGNEASHLMAREGSKQSTINKLMCFVVPFHFVESRVLEDKRVQGTEGQKRVCCSTNYVI